MSYPFEGQLYAPFSEDTLYDIMIEFDNPYYHKLDILTLYKLYTTKIAKQEKKEDKKDGKS